MLKRFPTEQTIKNLLPKDNELPNGVIFLLPKKSVQANPGYLSFPSFPNAAF